MEGAVVGRDAGESMIATSVHKLSPSEALSALLGRLEAVTTKGVHWAEARGRVLAEPLRADRDSPAHDVSAMDGYAVRLSDLSSRELPIAGEVMTGTEPSVLPKGAALRIFTGACVPPGAEAVIRREDVHETSAHIWLRVAPGTIESGQHIRRQGENLPAGGNVLGAGELVQPAVTAALASFGHLRPRVHRRVRVGVLVTGDELLEPGARPQPWEVRDSNGPALEAMFAGLSWVKWQGIAYGQDTLSALTDALGGKLETCDVVLVTGGVSRGDHDHVPAAVERVGGEVVFHKLPIRPGKPLLAAVGPGGQAILGLPGNPVSAMVTARRFACAALRRRAGFARPLLPPTHVRLANADEKALSLWWYRPVRLVEPGVAALVPGRGSGDVVGAARSDGFVELPQGASGEGPWPYWPWSAA